MTYQLDIPPDLGGSDITAINQYLDDHLNTQIFYALLHGIYTGLFAVILWIVVGRPVTHKSRPIGRVTNVAIILLFIVTTINFGFNWFFISSTFIAPAQSFQSTYFMLLYSQNSIFLGINITDTLITIIADSTMIWRCWIVSGQLWPAVLPPVLMLISGTVCSVFKLKDTYQRYTSGTDLATTIWCTALIIYFILASGRASDGIGGGLGVYCHAIEVLIQSSALYSVFLILFVPLGFRGDRAALYIDAVSGIARGIAPTLLVGRVTAGHTRPDDSWQGSTMSSLHFGTSRSQNSEQLSLEEEASQSSMPDRDLEAQREEMHGHEHTGNRDQEYIGSPSDDMLQDDLEDQLESFCDHYERTFGCPD
ncbi:hypothetical protein EDD18DRAFT_1333775 [Armillaria luteobubalina]|uniref:Uncharacterized protein n=1 Tax=Armillaria luteobubalina TaxID=153913 RepID=A0AA39PZI4_9AGAR|nr:hypothetical protein EDD18DRAFT_1333775 [Armillaria luteobubalina]